MVVRIALVVTFLAGCSIFGPIDGISDGTGANGTNGTNGEAGAPGTTDPERDGGGTTPGPGGRDAGSAPDPECSGDQPYEGAAAELKAGSYDFCGTVTNGDTDEYVYQGKTLQTKIEVENEDTLCDYLSSSTITGADGLNVNVQGQDNKQVLLRIYTTLATPQRYHLKITVR